MSGAPAYDLAAEQAVIGAVLLTPAVLADLTGTLSEGDFWRPAHGVLWQALCTMHAQGHPTDPIAVAAHLAETGLLGKVGGAAYLHTLMTAVPTTANAGHYARVVAQHAARRRLADLGAHLGQLAQSGTNPTEALAAARTLLDTTTDNSAGWPTPVPLSRSRQLPTFPAELLPDWVADMAFAVAEFTQTPIDLAGSIALACLSTAAGGRAEVQVRGSWHEPVNLYTVVALPPGSRKSPVFAALTGPLLAAEKTLAGTMAPVIIEAELAARVAGKTAEKAANAAANAADPAAQSCLLADATAAALHADAIVVPTKPQLVADDVTSETAASLLAEQGGRLAVLSAEGGIFATIAGRYSGTPNLEVFLKGHAGDMMRVGRQTRAAEHIDKPALTLGLAVQPEVLQDIAAMPGFRGKGLLARILYATPANTVGHRKIPGDPIPADIAEKYATTLTAMVLSLAEGDPTLLPLTLEASERVLDLERAVEPRLAPDGAWGHIVDWASKWVGAIVRIAALIHLGDHLHDGWAQPIDALTIDRAALIGDYYAAHALAAFDDMGADKTTRQARLVLAWIERTATTTFTKKELHRSIRSQIQAAADLDPVLSLLETHGYLRRLDPPPRTGAGRPPSPAYLVHPAVHQTTGPAARPSRDDGGDPGLNGRNGKNPEPDRVSTILAI